MLPAIIAALFLAAPPSTPESRLTNYIIKRSKGKATPYALTLARSILRESKRVGIEPAVMVAIGWVESRFIRTVRGSAGEYGIFQSMRSDVRMPSSWARLRPNSPAWKKLSKEAMVRALRDIKISTYLIADELAALRVWCIRAGHRIGRGTPPLWLMGPDGVHRQHKRKRYHRHPVDRYGHHNSGPKQPPLRYLRALRWQYRKAQRIINAR